MKCLVAIKRVVDPFVHIRVNKDGSGVETDNVKMSMNPFDEIAIEEAVRQKEAGNVTDIKVISIGDDKTSETIRQALALGADSAVHVLSKTNLIPFNIAKIIAAYVKEYKPDLIFLGKQSIDGDNNQTGQILSGLLGYSVATFASSVLVEGSKVIVEREVDAGIETVSLNIPAVITTDLRLNEPRYATLPNVMKAKQKTIEKKSIGDFDLDLAENISIVKVAAPVKREQGIKVSSVTELVTKLKEEAKVL